MGSIDRDTILGVIQKLKALRADESTYEDYVRRQEAMARVGAARNDRIMKQRYAESAFNDKAKSSAGAIGAFQIMPITLQDYLTRGKGEPGDLFDPVYNRKVRDYAIKMVPRDLGKYYSASDPENVRLAKIYAGYNMGAGALKSKLRQQQERGVDISRTLDWMVDLPKETRDYVDFIVNGRDVPGTSKTAKQYEKALNDFNGLGKGGKIHIAESKKGTFTAAAKKHGKSVQAFASQVLANKDNYSPAMVKKANFARNSAKWHGDGGLLNTFEDGGSGLLYSGTVPLMYSGSTQENKEPLFGELVDKYIDKLPLVRKILEKKRRESEEKRENLTEDQARLRAEMMTRYSGGVRNMKEALGMNMSRGKLLRTFFMDNLDKDVYSGKNTPKEHFDNSLFQDPVNYTGLLDFDRHNNEEKNTFKTTMFSDKYADDLVSSMFKDVVPFASTGMSRIPEEDVDMYQSLLGDSHSSLKTEDGFRGYQTYADTLDVSSVLNDLVRSGQYTPVLISGTDVEWDVPGQNRYKYDVGKNTRLMVPYNGKLYGKSYDVFDVKGIGEVGIPRDMTDFITKHSDPYVLTTPWYEYGSKHRVTGSR